MHLHHWHILHQQKEFLRFFVALPNVGCFKWKLLMAVTLRLVHCCWCRKSISNFNYVRLLLCRYFDVLFHIIDMRTVMRLWLRAHHVYGLHVYLAIFRAVNGIYSAICRVVSFQPPRDNLRSPFQRTLRTLAKCKIYPTLARYSVVIMLHHHTTTHNILSCGA